MKKIICDGIFNWLANEQMLTNEEKIDLHYAIRCRYNEVAILLCVALMGTLLHTTMLTLVAVVTFNFLRLTAGGLHANSLKKCALISTLMLAILPRALYVFTLEKWMYQSLLVLLPTLFYRYAPTAPHINMPSVQNAKKLKVKSVIRALCITCIGLICPSVAITHYILCGAYAQILTNLPLMYVILERSEKRCQLKQSS